MDSYTRRLQDIVQHPDTNAVYSLFGIVVSSIDGGHPIIDEMKNNCIGNIITKIGKQQLQLNEMLFILLAYQCDCYIASDLQMIISNNNDKCIVKVADGTYYTIIIEDKTLKIFNSPNSKGCKKDIDRLSKYDNAFKDIKTYSKNNYDIESNFKEATDILAMVMYMLNNRNDIDDVVVDKVDVQLMADLIQTYISRLREFESGRLEMSSYCINNNFISNSSSSYQYYNNYNHDSLNFLLKIRSGYSFEGMTYCSQHKKSYVSDCDCLSNIIYNGNQLKTSELLFFILFINDNNYNTIDPGYVYRDCDLESSIRENGIYYIPVCDKDYHHWTLWIADVSEAGIKFYIYDSLSSPIYKPRNRNARNEVAHRILSIFGCRSYEYDYEIVTIPESLKQSSSDSVNCGYYTLFFYGCAVKKLNLCDIPNIESFSIEYFKEDLFNGINRLSEDNKAKLYYTYSHKRFTYPLNFKKI